MTEVPAGASGGKRTVRPSAVRRWLFSALLLALVVGVVELSSCAAFRIASGKSFSFESLTRERDALAWTAGQALQAGREDLPGYVVNKALHPYVGYVYDVPPESERKAAGISRFGYLDAADPIRHRSDDRLIIGILGGSVAMGFGQSRSALDLLSRRLSASEAFRGRSVEYVRLGMSGYHQPQQLMTVAYLLSLGAEFDLLINLDGFNEVALHPAENGRSGVFPAYPRTWNLRLSNLTQEVTEEYGDARALQRLIARSFSRGPLDLSVTGNVVWWFLNRRLAGDVYVAQEKIKKQARERGTFAATGPEQTYEDTNEMARGLVALWRASSIQLARLAAANGIHYYQFLQPNQYVADSKTLGAEERDRAIEPESKFLEPVELGYPLLQAAGKALAAEGVRFTDLTQVFRDYEGPIYIDTCCHFNDDGFVLVAEAMADAIAADVPKALAKRHSANLAP